MAINQMKVEQTQEHTSLVINTVVPGGVTIAIM
jgi:hypothetical protein